MSATPTAAPVPPGPGTQPPFPAAPTEGGGARLGWTLGILSAVLVLCCGGGIAAGVGLIATGVSSLRERAHVTVEGYLDALSDEDYPGAYEFLCDPEQERLSLTRFTAREKVRERITSYEIGGLELTDEIWLEVTESYADGTTDQVRYPLWQDPKTGDLEVCGRD